MVTLYSTPTCSPCLVLGKRLDAAGVNWEKVDLTENPDRLADLKARRQSETIQTPILEFEGELFDITGFREVLSRAA